ncbi:MAG: hypothetical protein RLZ55_573, partial [Actinomycetota bacterium]
MAHDGPDPTEVAAWVRRVHAALAPTTQERTGALWGPVRMRHRTTRLDWFAGFDRAWAVPVPTHATEAITNCDAATGQSEAPDVDLITAALADLPPALPPAPLRKGDLGPRGEVLSLADASPRLVWDEAAGQVLAWDPETSVALMLTAEAPNGYEHVSPARFLVHWSTVAAGGLLLHGAVVGRFGHSPIPPPPRPEAPRGLLLLGEAGFGKSTSTLACLQQGWATCGDDAVAVFRDDHGWRAHAVYAAVKTKLADDSTRTAAEPPFRTTTHAPDLTMSPDVVTWTIEGRKRAHLLTQTDAAMMVPTMRVDGLVLLDPSGDPHAPVHRLPPAAARTRAAPSTTLPMPFERFETLRRIGDLSADLPAFNLPRRADLS